MDMRAFYKFYADFQLLAKTFEFSGTKGHGLFKYVKLKLPLTQILFTFAFSVSKGKLF